MLLNVNNQNIQLSNTKINLCVEDVYYHNILSKYNSKNIFGVNPHRDLFCSKNETKIYTIYSAIQDSGLIYDLEGLIFNFQTNPISVVSYKEAILESAYYSDSASILKLFLFQMMLHDCELYLLFEPFKVLKDIDKLIALRFLEKFQKDNNKYIVLFTQDIITLKLSNIEFEIFDSKGKISNYFNIIDKIQKNNKQETDELISKFFYNEKNR